MGWGISIDQDENGFVYCGDADFETGPDDYDGYPPCSYDMIYEGVESQHREIDMARDEIGLEAARAQAWEAFGDAKRDWDRLGEEEQWRIHSEWMKEKREAIKACVVDRIRKSEKMEQIKFFKNQYRKVIENIEADIARLELELGQKRKMLAEKRAPLDVMESELAVIMQPAETKKELQEIVRLEKEWAQGR